jgi:putative nucleotidyltransferase with HDIG domain
MEITIMTYLPIGAAMRKSRINSFEKQLIYITMSHLMFCTLAAFAISFFMNIKNDKKTENVYEWLLSEGYSVIITGILVLIAIGIGLIWVISVIRTDKRSLYMALGTHDVKFVFDEFEELNDIFIEKLNAIKSLKNNNLEMKKSLVSLDIAVKQIFYQYKNAIEKTQMLERDLVHLKDFYDEVSEKLSSLIWLVDYDGNLIYCNDLVTKSFKFESNQNLTIYDILKISNEQFDLFRKRDFQNILLYMKNDVTVSGKNKRLFDKESIKYILFISATSNQEKVMHRSYLKKSRDLHFINEISKIISGQIAIETTLQDAIEKIAFLGNFNSCSIRLINDKEELEIKALSGYSKEFVLNDKMKIANSHIGYAFNENKIVTINGVEDLLFDEPGVRKVILNHRKVAYIPLTNYNKNLGVLSIVSDYDFDSESVILLESISINVTIALEKILLFEKLKSNYFKTVEAFVTATEIKSERVNGHSRRVAEICKVIAEKLYLNSQEIDEIYMAGLLHDVGKLVFSDDSFEYYFDKDNHGAIGRKMVEKVGLTKDILDGIEHHHLDYNLLNSKSNEITEQPYYAQIIRIASDFDLYMNYETTNKNAPNFIRDMQPLIGSIYSPQFMRIMTDILSKKDNILLKIYQNEVVDENELL